MPKSKKRNPIKNSDCFASGIFTGVIPTFTRFKVNSASLCLPKQKSMKKKLPVQIKPLNNTVEQEAQSVNNDLHTELISTDDGLLSRYFDGKIVTVTYNKDKAAKFGNKVFEPGGFMGTIQEFFDLMKDWMNPCIIQHWCVLWNWVCQNRTFVIPYMPIDNIWAAVGYSPLNSSNGVSNRCEFSQTLNFFHNTTLELPILIEIEHNGRKKTEEATRMLRLFNFNIVKKNKKGDEYLNISGEFLPGFNLNKFYKKVFPTGFFELDASEEGRHIVLAHKICNWQDQLNDKPLRWSKEELVKTAGLETLYTNDPHEGCYQLTSILKRIVEVKCVRGFEPKKITPTLVEPITIFPLE